MGTKEEAGGGMSLALKNLVTWVAMGQPIGNRAVFGKRIVGEDGQAREAWELVELCEVCRRARATETVGGGASATFRVCAACAKADAEAAR